jgi:hypothetical protein
MSTFDAVGTNAVGTSGSTINASLSCAMLATSAVAAALTTTIYLTATVQASSTVAAVFTAQQAQLSTSLIARSAVSSSLSTSVNLIANLAATSSLFASLTEAQKPPSFTPSAARTIFVQSTAPVFTGSKWWNLTDSKKPRGLKDPDATIDITFDWSDWLTDIGAAIISDVTFTAVGVDNADVFHDNTTATIFVSGGTTGVPSTVACKIVTNTTPARTDERTVYIDIANE